MAEEDGEVERMEKTEEGERGKAGGGGCRENGGWRMEEEGGRGKE